jgi:hypothetical protein
MPHKKDTTVSLVCREIGVLKAGPQKLQYIKSNYYTELSFLKANDRGSLSSDQLTHYVTSDPRVEPAHIPNQYVSMIHQIEHGDQQGAEPSHSASSTSTPVDTRSLFVNNMSINWACSLDRPS